MKLIGGFLAGIATSEAVHLARVATKMRRRTNSVTTEPPVITTESQTRRKMAENEFLKDFYKECGREVTLAYTTLNQMKNWAIVVTAALLAAFASFTRPGADANVLGSAWLVALAASTLSLLFNVRFFIRAAICYVNLLRWNRLQKGILALMIPTNASEISDEKLTKEIDTYYHRWCSPINRWQQITSNLKLGFGLLLVTPLLVATVSSVVIFGNPIAMAISTFATAGLLVELYEFMTTPFLDTAEVKEKRATGDAFPGHSGRVSTMFLWTVAFILSAFSYVYFSLRELQAALPAG